MEDKSKVTRPPLDADLFALKAPGSEALLIEEPPNFLRSLSTLKNGLDYFHRDFSLPVSEAFVEESVQDIKNALSAHPQVSSTDKPPKSPPFVPHLHLALWTLGELYKDDAQRTLDKSLKARDKLIRELRGEEEPEEPLSSALSQSLPQSPSQNPPEDPSQASPPPVVPMDAKPFQLGVSDKNAEYLITAFLHLAKGVLRPGDLLWTPYKGFSELSEGRLKAYKAHPGILIYDDV
jgi:hypothetical protein